MKYRYQRVLVSYPLSDLNNKETLWSDLHWCDIEQDDDSVIHIRVTAVNINGITPNTEAFDELTGVGLTRIRVIDVANHNYYCLSLTNNTLRRFDFSSYHVLLPRGKKWTPEANNDEWSEIDTIMNKTMRGDADYNALKDLQARHNTWLQEQRVLAETVSKLHTIWLTRERKTPITFEEASSSHGRLNSKQRALIQTHLSSQLSHIKQISNSENAYSNALSNILNRQRYAGVLECHGDEANTTEEQKAHSHELNWAVTEFHSRFLHPGTLSTLYPDFYTGDTRKHADQPVRKEVHDYTLDLVLHELKKYQPQYIDQPFQREQCPVAYASQRIDHRPSRNSQLSQPSLPGISRNNNEYIQALLDNRKTIQHILLDERVLENHQIRTEIIDFLINDVDQLTQMFQLLELLEYLTPNEVADTVTRLSEFKWMGYATDMTALKQLTQKYPVLLTVLGDRFPHNHPIQLGILDATIHLIKPEYQQLSSQAKQVLHELQSLCRVKPSPALVDTIRLTIQVLHATPGKERTALLKTYSTQANDLACNHPSQYWKTLGVFMIRLGGLIAVVGGGLLLAGVVTPTAAGVLIAGGGVMYVAGALSFFHHQSKTEALHTFVERIEENHSPLLTCF